MTRGILIRHWIQEAEKGGGGEGEASSDPQDGAEGTPRGGDGGGGAAGGLRKGGK